MANFMASGVKCVGMDNAVIRQQLRHTMRQHGLTLKDLPETVTESEEYDYEPGGASLNGPPSAGIHPGGSAPAQAIQNFTYQPRVKSSQLNPASTPWVPSPSPTLQANSEQKQNEGYRSALPVHMNNVQAGLASNSQAISSSSVVRGETSSAQQIESYPTQNNGGTNIMSGLNFAPGHWAVPTTTTGTSDVPVIPTIFAVPHASNQAGYALNGQKLSLSASTGSLIHKTPELSAESSGQEHLKVNGSTQVREVVLSPGCETPKASKLNVGLATEPRNFAPAAAVDVTHLGIPPKFNLVNATAGTHAGVADVHDPFVTPTQELRSQPLLGPQVDAAQLLAVQYPPMHSFASNNAPLMTPLQGALQPYVGQAGPLVSLQTGYPSRSIVTSGNDAQGYVRSQRSRELNNLTAGHTGYPSISVAMGHENFPFIEPGTRPANSIVRGVVKIGNIPFVTNRSEIIAVLGRNSRMLNDADEPVHIIMERVTGKTTDAYVEFQSLEDAAKAVEKHQQNINRGRVTRIGQRPVEIELSSQGALMKDLFPSAKGVFWNNCNPQMLPIKPREPWDNFKGFVSSEEMTMLVKHVEVPHRSPFSKECPQRPYECLISTLTKFPWHMKAQITVKQRYGIHKATCELIRLLVASLREGRDEVNITARLLKRVTTAAMRCEGFSVTQKDDIAYLVNMSELDERAYGQPRFAESWCHLYSLTPKTGVPLDVIEWYIAVIREETCRVLELQPLQERNQTRSLGESTDGYFGYLWRELNHPVGPAFDNLTLAQLALSEYQTMEFIIRRALVHARSAQ
ncbi:hypothetical protein Cob_v011556 [Colletotrichum orbiculare MAFF 240422]|uniref:RRM domain-containing protein n=1 Tax=Colletotrichum orbiculare (strain 104-T / ATCC 96160 / CBS 514.97 / LARS 414 / MAFF 240422) TaxID=1213857 RepID=N4V5U5_COLOR|nr:hypothetical protein Cob_v011556 [Colletotrichum orbiculare MAFF 240422]